MDMTFSEDEAVPKISTTSGRMQDNMSRIFYNKQVSSVFCHFLLLDLGLVLYEDPQLRAVSHCF